MSPALFSQRHLASAARGDIEAALDHHGWPWRRQLSLWLDALVIIEESSAP